MHIGHELPSPAVLLFNRPTRPLLWQIGREPINMNNDDGYYKAIILRQKAHTKDINIHTVSTFFSV